MGLYLIFSVYPLNAFLQIKYKFSYVVPKESREGAVAMASFVFATFCPRVYVR